MKKFVTIIFISLQGFLFAQQNVEFKKENFPNDKGGLKDANQNIKIGDDYYLTADYLKYLAIDYYFIFILLPFNFK